MPRCRGRFWSWARRRTGWKPALPISTSTRAISRRWKSGSSRSGRWRGNIRCCPTRLGTFAEELRGRLAALDGGTKQIDALRRALAEAEAAWEAEAAILSEARREAAGRLDAAMAAELAPLKMERAVFETQVTEADPGPEGRDAVAFTVATNPGAPAGPLNRIASGGEPLALPAGAQGLPDGRQPRPHADLRRDRPRGRGATADAVGRRLKALAEGAQVLVVTHSPQVAALGAHHWRVEKRVAHGMTTSTVSPLGAGDRIEEIARMLAGDTITDAAREAARALLDRGARLSPRPP